MIFSQLAYCLKAALNENIQQVKDMWIKDNGVIYHIHNDLFLFINHHHLEHHLYVGRIASRLKAEGVRDVKIRDSNNKFHILISILFDLKCELISLNTLAFIRVNSTFK